MSSDIGVYGLGVMGINLALNIASKGFNVSVGNRSPEKVDDCIKRAHEEGLSGKVCANKKVEDFCASLHRPRKIIILVQAGAAVDSTINTLIPHLESGDILIDGGNEWYETSILRTQRVEQKSIYYVAMGVSGGEIGARNGPSLMPGGQKHAYDILEPILTKIAAQVDGEACVTYIGGAGSGNYVKMVHNGIEYADMQLISEVYGIMREAGLSNEKMSEVFNEWNKTELESYLIEITALILSKKDCDIPGLEAQEGFVIDKILDCTGSKGTGMMTVKEAAERGVAAPAIASALFERFVSSQKDQRMKAAKVIQGPVFNWEEVDKEQLIADLRDALFCSKVISYTQGLHLIQQASNTFNWGIQLGECARIWKGGCIIRAKILDKIKQAYTRDPTLISLILDSTFTEEILKRQIPWRRIVALAVSTGVSCPALSSCLAYFDSYRKQSLPANLLQAQRDFFGSHTFERVDQPRGKYFHCLWTPEHA